MKGVELELPAGFRFHPTDDELVNHYLCKKCKGQPISVPIIAELGLYKYDPCQLPEMARCGEKEWYFFSPTDRKYPNGTRPNRAAGTGYWKATGADKPIGRPKALGIKKALVFYAGKSPKGIKTNWIMHEYRLMLIGLLERELISGKKGSLEKHYESDKKSLAMNEDEHEQEQKPDILNMYKNMDSWDSDHSEVQSESKPSWNLDLQSQNGFDFGLKDDDPFGFKMDQLSPLEDMFMYLHTPF